MITKCRTKSCSLLQMVEVPAVMHKVLPLWSGFMLNVLSFKGSEKLNIFHHKGVVKPFLLRFPLCSLKDAQCECWAHLGGSDCAESFAHWRQDMVLIVCKGEFLWSNLCSTGLHSPGSRGFCMALPGSRW